MSQYADIKETLRQVYVNTDMTEEQCAELFVKIMGDLQWDIDDVDMESPTWVEDELKAARKELFGES